MTTQPRAQASGILIQQQLPLIQQLTTQSCGTSQREDGIALPEKQPQFRHGTLTIDLALQELYSLRELSSPPGGMWKWEASPFPSGAPRPSGD
jgi:hypothetical protein